MTDKKKDENKTAGEGNPKAGDKPVIDEPHAEFEDAPEGDKTVKTPEEKKPDKGKSKTGEKSDLVDTITGITDSEVDGLKAAYTLTDPEEVTKGLINEFKEMTKDKSFDIVDVIRWEFGPVTVFEAICFIENKGFRHRFYRQLP